MKLKRNHFVQANKELDKYRALVTQLQQKITLMERCDVSKNMEKQTDLMVKNLKNTHQQQVTALQTKIDLLTKQLQDKVSVTFLKCT